MRDCSIQACPLTQFMDDVIRRLDLIEHLLLSQQVSPELLEHLEKIEKLCECKSESQGKGNQQDEGSSSENTSKDDKQYHVTFEKVEIQELKLDKLSFFLDTLDVDDLSGTLNIGNNFGVTDKKGSKQSSNKKDEKTCKSQKEYKKSVYKKTKDEIEQLLEKKEKEIEKHLKKRIKKFSELFKGDFDFKTARAIKLAQKGLSD